MKNTAVTNQILEAIYLAEKEARPSFLDLIEMYRDRTFVVYGVGRAGKQIYTYLKEQHIKVAAFIDRTPVNGDNLDGLPIYTPDAIMDYLTEKERSEMVAVMALVTEKEVYQAIEELLHKAGFRIMFDYFTVRFQFKNLFDMSSNAVNTDYYKDNMDRIHAAADLFEEPKSKELYVNYLCAYITKNMSLYTSAATHKQYFPDDISLKKGYARFIDCGAFDGDTARELIAQKGSVEKLVMFEPGTDAFAGLQRWAAEAGTQCYDEIYLFPCGVHSKTALYRFSANGTGSQIMDDGEEFIQCVAIDDILFGINPTFIKMDVEGSECDALRGARKNISRYKPDLAICVYHYTNDIWEIPLLIDSWNLGYKFYLRSYLSNGFETVLYATCD